MKNRLIYSKVCLCLQIRNHILAKWRADVSRWLTEEEAAAKIMSKYRHLVSAAWRFLTTHGYINFGIAPEITEQALKADDTKGSVIIVGAGLAGEPLLSQTI